MIYVLENQLAFDSNELGFPSIDGCHALVMQTDHGLYGVHLYGTPKQKHTYTGADIWERKSGALGDFVRNHHLTGKVKRIYSACHHSRRGFGEGGTWKGEVKAYARAAGYKGKVESLDLDAFEFPSSAYVEYRKVGQAVYVFVKSWADMDDDTQKASAGLATPNLRMIGAGVSEALGEKDNVTVSVSHTGGADLRRVPAADHRTVKV